MIRAVLFDLDGTLYDRDAHILEMARRQFAMFGPELDGIRPDRFLARTVELDQHGHNRPPHVFHILMEEWGLSPELAQSMEADFRANFHRNLVLSADTLETLKALRDRGKTLGIITNGPAYWQSAKVDSLGIREYFKTVVISGEEGVQKPDPVIFERAVARCGVAVHEAMYVGDHPDADIRGALSAGLVPVWKRMPYWEVPAEIARVDNLSELLSLCGD